MSSLRICIFAAAILILFSAANAYPTSVDPRLGREVDYEEIGRDLDGVEPQSVMKTRQDALDGVIAEQTLSSDENDDAETDEDRSIDTLIEGLSQILQDYDDDDLEKSSYSAESTEGEPPLTKEEMLRDLARVRQDLKKAESENGGSMSLEDLEKFEEKLMQQPWYRRLSTGILQFLIGSGDNGDGDDDDAEER